ncbi:MAG TPA: adenylate/guanylate cyclase domain-containing protein [Gemmatimonadaceae bacterium]|jgi:class 3 adenylate cyclase/YHS domain-containing protein|nr:adenylate/guanylate cyclase domain-containing protein [Gemmatimonadaceae bacterium]
MLETALASYVDPQVVRHILSGGKTPLLSGVRRTVSCLFADIRGFTRFAASANPVRVVALLDRFFASVCQIAVDHGGSIDKLLGDGIMVLFGVPNPRGENRERALSAAIAMVEVFDASIADVIAPDDRRRCPRLGLGAGIATGPVILANVGSTTRMDYTVIGAAVNLAARLCAEARPREVLCDTATARNGRLPERAAVRSATRSLRVKGIRGVVRVHAFAVKVRSETATVREAIDPVCGMKVRRTPGHEWRHRSRLYWFCSLGCRARFVRNPKRFS